MRVARGQHEPSQKTCRPLHDYHVYRYIQRTLLLIEVQCQGAACSPSMLNQKFVRKAPEFLCESVAVAIDIPR